VTLTVVDGRTARHPGDPTLVDYWTMLPLNQNYLQPPLVQMQRIIADGGNYSHSESISCRLGAQDLGLGR
jgi:hypothetical protein